MPAKSKAQQKAAGAALSAKRGETPKSKLKGASKEMAESMTEKQLEDWFTRTRAIRRSIIAEGQDDAAPDFGRKH